ncbi:methylase [Kitasatospora sp. MMS16-BH015]|uniref:class I SAM-dependent methyltransferase n=1 Tax=Kitasatospora sp. MMS16-BH015 TaxID=2018025 RepID=UPI000CA3E159|nr:class I SAM-dependent methyltransferase [Kitasatospora sp. MMS16-BH015]AUG77058.1 methylase [Kitasatospora sp. MMS16-BH015]
MTTPARTTPVDLWHHYGRTRGATDRAVPDRFCWNWAQDGGPGVEILGDLAGRCIVDLGSGAGRHSAHLAAHHRPTLVDAVDASPAQHAMALDLFGHLAPVLRPIQADVTRHLFERPSFYDIAYSVFGAVDFTDPHRLLPAIADALCPGGLLVIATLGHYLTGVPAEPDAVPAEIPARTPEGAGATLRRWVLQEHVWTELLDQAGFTGTTVERLPSAVTGPRTADTLLLRCKTGGARVRTATGLAPLRLPAHAVDSAGPRAPGLPPLRCEPPGRRPSCRAW